MRKIFTRKNFYTTFFSRTQASSPEQNRRRFHQFRLQKILLVGMLLLSIAVTAQVSGDYRSVANGNWTALATWQRYNGTAWVTPTAGQGYPGQFAGTATVNIINGNTVTLNATVPQTFSVLLIGNGSTAGTLSIAGNSTLTVPRINVASNGTISFTGNFDLQFPANAVFTIEPGGLLSTGGGPCNSQKTIRIGTTVLSTCNGNSTAYSFAELMAAGGFIAVSPSFTRPCVGGTLQLFANRTGGIGPFSFTWTGPNGFTATTANPTITNVTAAAAGVYTVTASDNNFSPALTNTNSVTVTINLQPTLTGASQAATVCAGSSATINLAGLQANTTSTIAYSINSVAQTPVTGVVANGSGAASFNTSALTAANNGQILSVTSVAITSATPTCTANFTQNVTLSVTPAPAATISYTGNPFCKNTGTFSVTRTGTAGGTYSYDAVPGSTLFLSPVTGAVNTTGSTPGTYTVHYQISASGGCPFYDVTTTVTINTPSVAPTTISGSATTICQGFSTSLTVSGGTLGTGAVARWYSGSCGGTLVGSGPSINVTPLTTTTYFVRYEGTCGNTTCVSQQVTVNIPSTAPTAITGTNTICPGGSTTLTVSGGTPGTGAVPTWYTISCGGTPAGTGNSITVSPAAATTYFVRYEGTCNTTTCASQLVTVSTASTPPTSITGNNTICTGGSTILTRNGGTLGTGATAQWYTGSCGGTAAGTGNSITVSPTVTTTYYLRYENPCSVTACVSTTVTVGNTNNWIGGGSNLWSDGTQWSCGAKPLATQTVLLANNGSPMLDENYTAAGNLLVGASLVSLIINPNAVLTISGSADFNSRPVIVKSTAAGTGAIGTISGSLIGATDVTVERYFPARRAWRLVSAPPLSGSQTLKEAWCNNRTISDPSQAAAEPPGIGTLITGQGYTNPQPEYDYIGWALMSSIRRYQATATGGGWPATVANTPSRSTTLSAAQTERAYLLFVRGDRTVTTGAPNTTTLFPRGTLRIGTQSSFVFGSATNKYTPLGNPYASTIDFESVMNNASNSSIATPDRMWIWNPTVAPFGGYNLVKKVAGQWYLVPSNFDTNMGAANANARYIQSGQGFMIEPTAAGGLLTIMEANKANPSGTLPTVFSPMGLGQVFANLYYDLSSGLTLSDGVLAVFGDGNSLGTGDENDVSKAMNMYENFGLFRNGTQLTMEAHPSINTDDTLYFDLSGTSARTYALKFMPVDMPPGMTAKLIDNFTGKEALISMTDSAQSTYKFSVTADPASAAANRFKLVFKAGQILPVMLSSAKAFQVSQNIQVEWQTTNEQNIRSYEIEKSVDGRNFEKLGSVPAQNSSAASYSWLDINAIAGNNFYRIKTIATGEMLNYSHVLLVRLGDAGNNGFSVYPNPARGRTLGIQFTNLAKGIYTLSIYNQAGQLISSKSINHMGGSASEEISLGSSISKGVYKVGLVSDRGSIYYQNLVVQ